VNIFILDYDIKKSAYSHCDQHVNKMILEAAQMLCTVASEYGIIVPYKPTHSKHPCTLWVAKSLENYIYTLDYAFWLNEASKERYNRAADHKSWLVLESLPIPDLPSLGLTSFAKAMPEEFKSISDPVEAYRAYYRTKEFATWKNNQVPEWFKHL